MNYRKILLTGVFVVSLISTAICVYKFGTANQSSASVVKNYKGLTSSTGLSDVEYEGKKMFVAKSTFFDFYSDSQVGEGESPKAITDALDYKKNTFGKLNTRMLELMKYGDKNECPAKYPLYVGRQSGEFPDFANIYSKSNNAINEAANYWVGANHNQIGACATQGLIDEKLSYDSNNVSYITQSNPENGKSCYVPFFDKKFLTTNKHTDSKLSLGSVRENVSFPFRTETENGVTYYEFDSAVDTIRFNSNNQLSYLGKNSSEMVKDRLGNGGLFPDNVAADSNSNRLNFGYAVKIEVPFNMTSDGKLNGQDIIYEFTGDDDVWVFVDDYLVLDMGGPHPKTSGSINFATQKSVVSCVKNNQVAFASRTIRGYGTGNVNMSELGLVNVPAVYNNKETAFNEDLKKILADTSRQHTLTLFYVERGMDVSNMKMKFNLPEPSMLTVVNKVDTSTVNETFKSETDKLAKTDRFLYDVADKTKSKQAEIDLLGDENVAFIEEFTLNDILLIQSKGLKVSTRKLTDLYTTSWVLTDKDVEISHDTSLVTNDTRTSDKTVLFKNTKDDKSPKLTTTYTNKPNVNKFMIACDVSSKYKESNKTYKDKEIEYKVTYSKVFGGSSTEAEYKGEYIVYNEDDSTKKMTANNGILKIKPGQKVLIESIPVQTNIKVVANLGENEILSAVRTTSQYTYNKDAKEIIGAITNTSNVAVFVVGVSTDTQNDKNNLSDEEIKDITGEEVPKLQTPEKLEDTPNKDDYDNVPKTDDSTNFRTWLTFLLISLLVVFASGIGIVKYKNID